MLTRLPQNILSFGKATGNLYNVRVGTMMGQVMANPGSYGFVCVDDTLGVVYTGYIPPGMGKAPDSPKVDAVLLFGTYAPLIRANCKPEDMKTIRNIVFTGQIAQTNPVVGITECFGNSRMLLIHLTKGDLNDLVLSALDNSEPLGTDA